MRALVSLSALSLVWSDHDNEAMAERLAALLVKIFDADFVYISVPSHLQSLELAFGPQGRVPSAGIAEVRTSLQGLPFRRPRSIQSSVSGEPATVLTMPVGVEGRTLLAVAVNRPTYPTEFDRLILQMAANEVMAATERAESQSVATHLAAMVGLSSNFIGLADLHGMPLYVNPAGLELVGLANIREARELHVVDFLESRDQDRARYVVWPEVLSKGRWTGQLSFLNATTGKGTPLLVECFRIDAPTTEPVAVGTISVDILHWNRAEGIANDPSTLPDTRQLMLAMARIESLSGREGEVMQALAAGHSHKVIAHELGLSVRTIEVHRSRMMRRLGVRSLAEAIKLAVISGAVR